MSRGQTLSSSVRLNFDNPLARLVNRWKLSRADCLARPAMAGQQNGLRNGQLAQPSLAARMNSGAFLGSYSLGGTPIKAEQKPTVQATPPQPSQGPSLLQRTNSSGGGGEGGSLLARMGGEQAAESRAGSSTSTGQGGSGRGINVRDLCVSSSVFPS